MNSESPPVSILPVSYELNVVDEFFKVSDHHNDACVQWTGTSLAIQLRTMPPGTLRRITIERFLHNYNELHESDWKSQNDQSEALIAKLKKIQEMVKEEMK